MVPVVFGHEEQAAVPRVVIAMRPALELLDARFAVGACAWIEKMLVRISRAGEILRCRNLHERTLVHWAAAGRRLDVIGIIDARPCAFQANGNELHSALRTDAGFAF